MGRSTRVDGNTVGTGREMHFVAAIENHLDRFEGARRQAPAAKLGTRKQLWGRSPRSGHRATPPNPVPASRRLTLSIVSPDLYQGAEGRMEGHEGLHRDRFETRGGGRARCRMRVIHQHDEQDAGTQQRPRPHASTVRAKTVTEGQRDRLAACSASGVASSRCSSVPSAATTIIDGTLITR